VPPARHAGVHEVVTEGPHYEWACDMARVRGTWSGCRVDGATRRLYYIDAPDAPDNVCHASHVGGTGTYMLLTRFEGEHVGRIYI